MSTFTRYDPALFTLRRRTSTSSNLDEFLVGTSVLNANPSTWTTITAATATLTYGYSPHENGTLIIDAETATITLSFWDESGELLYPADRIEMRYNNEVIFYGTVDSTELTFATDPEAARHGATRRVDFTATAAGVYAVLMSRTVKWVKIPDEPSIDRIRRWVTVNGWD